jgi:nucleoside-diphosphate-sugar epimerase
MRIFLTGATGFICSNLVSELINAGHRIAGLARSDDGAKALALAGEQHSENDRRVIQTLGEALSGSDRPLIITSGTGLIRPDSGHLACEVDACLNSNEFPRAATEEAADELIARGDRVMVVRLPQVHDLRHQGRIALHIQLARQKGWVAYIGDGTNCVPPAHVSDVARLYRLALEKGEAGCRYQAVSEEGVPMRDIAEVIGQRLNMPVRSSARQDATDYFGPLASLAAMDLAASGTLTRQWLDWHPASTKPSNVTARIGR